MAYAPVREMGAASSSCPPSVDPQGPCTIGPFFVVASKTLAHQPPRRNRTSSLNPRIALGGCPAKPHERKENAVHGRQGRSENPLTHHGERHQYRYEAGTCPASSSSFTRPQIPPSQSRPSRYSGPHLPSFPRRLLRAWVLLASSPRLPSYDGAHYTAGILARQIRGQHRTRPAGASAIAGRRLAGSDHLGMRLAQGPYGNHDSIIRTLATRHQATVRDIRTAASPSTKPSQDANHRHIMRMPTALPRSHRQ